MKKSNMEESNMEEKKDDGYSKWALDRTPIYVEEVNLAWNKMMMIAFDLELKFLEEFYGTK